MNTVLVKLIRMSFVVAVPYESSIYMAADSKYAWSYENGAKKVTSGKKIIKVNDHLALFYTGTFDIGRIESMDLYAVLLANYTDVKTAKNKLHPLLKKVTISPSEAYTVRLVGFNNDMPLSFAIVMHHGEAIQSHNLGRQIIYSTTNVEMQNYVMKQLNVYSETNINGAYWAKQITHDAIQQFPTELAKPIQLLTITKP